MNMRLLGQAVLQALGLISATIKYKNRLINCIDNYLPKVEYTFPFDGEWYVANGGVTKNTSHSWEVLPQGFAYDFVIMDEVGKLRW